MHRTKPSIQKKIETKRSKHKKPYHYPKGNMIGLFIADERSQGSDYVSIFMKSEFSCILIHHIKAYVDISLNNNSTRGGSVTTYCGKCRIFRRMFSDTDIKNEMVAVYLT